MLFGLYRCILPIRAWKQREQIEAQLELLMPTFRLSLFEDKLEEVSRGNLEGAAEP